MHFSIEKQATQWKFRVSYGGHGTFLRFLRVRVYFFERHTWELGRKQLPRTVSERRDNKLSFHITIILISWEETGALFLSNQTSLLFWGSTCRSFVVRLLYGSTDLLQPQHYVGCTELATGTRLAYDTLLQKPFLVKQTMCTILVSFLTFWSISVDLHKLLMTGMHTRIEVFLFTLNVFP